MLILASTSDLIRIVTSGAAQIEVHASYVDLDTATDPEAEAPILVTPQARGKIVRYHDVMQARDDRTMRQHIIEQDDIAILAVISEFLEALQ